MYNFIYYFIYTLVKNRNGAPESYSGGAVLIMIIFHLAVPVGIAKYFFGLTLPTFSDGYLPNKLMLMPIFFGIYWLTSWYYEKQSDRICDKYDKKYGKGGRKLYSAKNIIVVVALYIIPLLIGIQLVNNS